MHDITTYINPFHILQLISSKTDLNIIFTSIPSSSKLFCFFGFSKQSYTSTSHFRHFFHALLLLCAHTPSHYFRLLIRCWMTEFFSGGVSKLSVTPQLDQRSLCFSLKLLSLGAFVNFRKATICRVCPPISLSVRMEKLVSHWTNFREIWNLRFFFENLERKFKFYFKKRRE
jgi:hypothetical protein